MEHGERPAGPEQVLHQVPAGWLQVDQQRHTGPDPIEVLEAEIDPRRPAMASRCTTALVDPPMAASVTMALWKDARVITWEMVLPCCTSSTASRPDSCAPSSSRLSGAGCRPVPGSSCRAPRP